MGDAGAVQDLDLRPRGAERGIAQVVDVVQGVAVDRLERGEHAPALVDVADREDRRGQHPGGPGALADEGLVLGVLPDGSWGGDVGRVLQPKRLPQSEELRGAQLVDRLHLDEDPAAGGGGGHPGHGTRARRSSSSSSSSTTRRERSSASASSRRPMRRDGTPNASATTEPTACPASTTASREAIDTSPPSTPSSVKIVIAATDQRAIGIVNNVNDAAVIAIAAATIASCHSCEVTTSGVTPAVDDTTTINAGGERRGEARGEHRSGPASDDAGCDRHHDQRHRPGHGDRIRELAHRDRPRARTVLEVALEPEARLGEELRQAQHREPEQDRRDQAERGGGRAFVVDLAVDGISGVDDLGDLRRGALAKIGTVEIGSVASSASGVILGGLDTATLPTSTDPTMPPPDSTEDRVPRIGERKT